MDYFERLESETLKLYEIANEARSKGFDAYQRIGKGYV